ncbi:MAG: ribosome-binding factor A, partial [Polyangiales bacterium]
MKRHEEGTGHRHARLQELLLEELRSLFSDDISDPELEGVAIVAVVLSVDYRHLRVHYAAPSQGRDLEHALRRATPFLRRSLADALDLKIVPDLRFVPEIGERSD